MKLFINNIDSIAIGKFDGIHLGHQKLFSKLEKNGAIVIIDKERDRYLLPKQYFSRYTDIPIFRYLLTDIRELNGKEFIKKLEIDFPDLKEVIVGYDFKFGNGRNCSIQELKKYSNFKITVIDEVKSGNISIHSGEIIRRLKSGEIELANRFLGRQFSIIGKHIKGQGVGKRSLVPTINIDCSEFISPKNGVYLTETVLKSGTYKSISFLGVRETTDNKFSLETYILDRECKDIDFGEVKTRFIKYIRDNKKFQNLESLKNQILEDIKIANSYL